MSKKVFCFALGMLFALCASAEAQQTGKIPRIGILEARSPSDRPEVWAQFRQRLRDLAYIEGKNIVLEYRYAGGNNQLLPELAADLVRLKVDIIVASDSQPAVAARKITTTIPIIMIGGRDPVEAGLAASLARPGGNVTGLTSLAPELLGKRLELLKEAVPRISRVAVLVEASGGGRTAALTKEMAGPVKGLGIQLGAVEVRGPNPDFHQAFRGMIANREEALVIGPMPALVPHMKRIVELSTKNRFPTMAASIVWVNGGRSCPMAPIRRTQVAAQPLTWTKSSRELSLVISRLSSPSSSTSLLTSRQQSRSVSRYRSRCCFAQTR